MFVGRARSVEQISTLVADTPVVTLTGPGGVGKTRLGLQVAAVLQPEFPDGAWLADLAPVNTADRVAAVVLETLGYTLAAGEDDVTGLCARLRRRRLLLVIDNCEHMVASVAMVVDAISARAPEVRVIATSREGLGIPAERVVPIAPLTTDADGDAVELFVTRARAARSDFTLDAASTPTVVELCRRLDGIPLAIELAAARTRSMAPARILERLDERFRMLTGGSRTAVARHQTLQAAVDWSYELLSDDESSVLDRLSVFAGTFTLDAAEAVAGDDHIDAFDVLEHVGALVDKSLVVAEPGGERYRLLETIRQYAAGRLAAAGSAEPVRSRHAEYYRAAAGELATVGRAELEALDRVSAEIDNLRVMLDWYHDDRQPALVVDAIWALREFWWWRGHHLEMIGRLEATVGELGDDHLSLCRAHAMLAWMKAGIGYAGVPEHAERSAAEAELAGVPTPVQAIGALGTWYVTFGGDTERAIEQSLLAAEAASAMGAGDLALHFRIVALIYTVLVAPGTDETIALAVEVGRDVDRVASVVLRQMWLQSMAIAVFPIDSVRSLALLDEALDLAARASLRDGTGTALFWVGIVLFTRREYPDAAAALRRALVLFHEIGSRRGMTNVLSVIVGLVLRTGRSEATAALLGGLRRRARRVRTPRIGERAAGRGADRGAAPKRGWHLRGSPRRTTPRPRGDDRPRARHPRRDRRRGSAGLSHAPFRFGRGGCRVAVHDALEDGGEQRAGARDLGLERARPADGGAAAGRGDEIDVGVVAAHGDAATRSCTPGGAAGRTRRSARRREGRRAAELADRADATRRGIALALPLRDRDHRARPLLPTRRVGEHLEHDLGRRASTAP